MFLFFVYCRWFHDKITRETAEKLLEPHRSQNGLFLVRESVNFPGDFTLSVCFSHKVEHYRIIYRGNKMTIDEESYFENLAELVEVGKEITLSVKFLEN